VDKSSNRAKSVDTDEQVAEKASVDNSSDMDRSVDEGEQVAEHSLSGQQ
jgi:hypothetical protein